MGGYGARAMTDAAAYQEITNLRRLLLRINRGLIVAGIFILGVPLVGTWWLSRQIPMVNTVSIDTVRTTSEMALCHGDKLVFEYNFHARGAGVLVRDLTAYNVDPPKTMVFSSSRRFILDGPVDQHLREAWTIPHTYHNYETDEDEPLPPGNYLRYLAISSPSRSTVIAIVAVPFLIREDCK